ncbi:zinc ribbon domain-containing protein [Streptosporangium sp. NPDC023963]|uniref:zinc ribbon domain-containing protein n=1 Tax=Streptosporangium sp. NPDC023963 TaxID=3155608 RepID=UPI00343F1183
MVAPPARGRPAVHGDRDQGRGRALVRVDPVLVDRWFPSSKLCSACGTTQRSMPLGVRDWVCACGAVHDGLPSLAPESCARPR